MNDYQTIVTREFEAQKYTQIHVIWFVSHSISMYIYIYRNVLSFFKFVYNAEIFRMRSFSAWPDVISIEIFIYHRRIRWWLLYLPLTQFKR